jgi:hypothetical protein
VTWWTFAGSAANRALAAGLREFANPFAPTEDLAIRMRPEVSIELLRSALTERR